MGLNIVVTARDCFQGLTYAQQMVANAHTHVQIEPIRLRTLDGHVHIHPVLRHLDGAHVLRDVPHEAVHALAINDG